MLFVRSLNPLFCLFDKIRCRRRQSSNVIESRIIENVLQPNPVYSSSSFDSQTVIGPCRQLPCHPLIPPLPHLPRPLPPHPHHYEKIESVLQMPVSFLSNCPVAPTKVRVPAEFQTTNGLSTIAANIGRTSSSLSSAAAPAFLRPDHGAVVAAADTADGVRSVGDGLMTTAVSQTKNSFIIIAAHDAAATEESVCNEIVSYYNKVTSTDVTDDANRRHASVATVARASVIADDTVDRATSSRSRQKDAGNEEEISGRQVDVESSDL